MKLYYVARAKSLHLICGPFRTVEQAEQARQNYDGTIWGNCVIVSHVRK